jgi:phosphate transport system substrate-binding protein
MNARIARAALALMLSACASFAHSQNSIAGAGSSAAAPIYRTWAREYEKATGVTFTYDAVGSSAGLKKIKGGETGFGASDIAPASAELNADNLVLFPVAITGIAPVVNLPRVADGQLRLTGDVLARIFLGEIAKWSAPEIRQLNPGLPLPDAAIKVVARSDGSGTTYNFSDYLAKVHAPWKERMGVKAQFAWPASVAAVKGSDGVVKAVKETVNSIGYVDYGYVVDNKLAAVAMRNEEGEFVKADTRAFQAALGASDWVGTGAFSSTLTAQRGKSSWPITMGTFIVVPRVTSKPEQTQAALKFFVWAFNHGDALVREANFVRLPDRVQASAFKAITSVHDTSGKPLGMTLF